MERMRRMARGPHLGSGRGGERPGNGRSHSPAPEIEARSLGQRRPRHRRPPHHGLAPRPRVEGSGRRQPNSHAIQTAHSRQWNDYQNQDPRCQRSRGPPRHEPDRATWNEADEKHSLRRTKGLAHQRRRVRHGASIGHVERRGTDTNDGQQQRIQRISRHHRPRRLPPHVSEAQGTGDGSRGRGIQRRLRVDRSGMAQPPHRSRNLRGRQQPLPIRLFE